jgi:hypothetical protein
MIVFGGDIGYGVSNATWSLSLGDSPVWEELWPLGDLPDVRYSAAAIYDPVGRRMIVCGGNNGGDDPGGGSQGRLGDVWSLSFDGLLMWQQLRPAGPTPGPIERACATYDSRRHQMLLFGGSDDHSAWALDLDGPPTWHRVVSDSLLTPPSTGGCFYDSTADRLIVGSGAVVWQLTLGESPAHWSSLTPSGPRVPNRYEPAIAQDPGRRRLFVFGGGTPGIASDLTCLQWEMARDVTPVLVSLVSADVENGLVRIIWKVDAGGGRCTIERAGPGGAWAFRAAVTPDGMGRIVFEDASVHAGDRFGYRLIASGGDVSQPTGEVWIDIPGAVEWSLSAPTPNPAGRIASLRVSLPSRSTGTVQLLDICGRRMASQSLGNLSIGSHLLSFDVAALPAGVYVMQLRDRGRSLTRRLVVMR